METNFEFIYSLHYCILANEEELPVENKDEDIVSTLEQMRISTSNVTVLIPFREKCKEFFWNSLLLKNYPYYHLKKVILWTKNQHVFKVYKIYIQSTSDAKNHCSTWKWNKHRINPNRWYYHKTWSWKANEG